MTWRSFYSPEQKVNSASFGCVIITAIDEAKLRAALYDQLNINLPLVNFNSNLMEELINDAVNQFKDAMAHGDALCPAPLPEESTWDYVVDQLTEFWKSVVQAFNAIKNSLVNVVAEGLNGLFGADFCGETCKAGLMTALNYSITYFTGIPPTLPSFGELVEHGIDYTVSLAISEAGIPCDADCAAEIRAGVETVAEAVTAAQSQPGCSSAAAHWYGKQALCLPDGLTTQPLPGGVYIPGIVTLQATRNGQGFQWSSESDYSVLITTTVRNEAVVGQSFWFYGPMWYAGHQDNLPERMNFPYTIPEPMEGFLFEPASMVLPDTLDTGSQLVIPVTLNTLTYAPLEKGYTYPPLLAYALGQAQAKDMPGNLMEELFWGVKSNSNWYRASRGIRSLSKPYYCAMTRSPWGRYPARSLSHAPSLPRKCRR